MATQQEFIKTPVPVLNRSAFNKDHQNLLTMKVGTLTPVLVDELIPDSTIKLRAAAIAKLPPLASDTFMRVRMHLEAFFVPFRILYGGYGAAMSGATLGGYATQNLRQTVPFLRVKRTSSTSPSDTVKARYASMVAPGSLSDYLGLKLPVSDSNIMPSKDHPLDLNIFPYLCYHRIYDDWYRRADVQHCVFCPPTYSSGSASGLLLPSLPYMNSTIAQTGDSSVGGSTPFDVSYNLDDAESAWPKLADGKSIFNLRQRNFGHDYFTSATLTPTIGDMPKLVISSSVDGSVATGEFTIGVLRSINSLTQFAERNALAGVRYDDWLRANYGVHLPSNIEGRAQYLGRMVFDVYSKGVSQSSNATGAVTQNPFDSVGAQYGNAIGTGEDTLCDEFHVVEPGMLMVIASLVPRPTYSTGAARYLRHYTRAGFRGDLANQVFENVGPQPIFKSELDGNYLAHPSDPDSIFGYTDRFAEYKTKFDELHGLLRDGQSLESFALQRSVNLNGASLSSVFLQIPTNFLDQVSAVDGDISQYGCWMDCAFDYKVVQPLSRYSQPSLIMPAERDGHTVDVTRSGSHL